MDEQKETIRARVIVSGRVQGVWFRGTACERARELGVSGWVRNRPDGNVEAVIEGPRRQVRQMVAWCYRGPRMAQVQHVDLAWEEPTGEFAGFSVVY